MHAESVIKSAWWYCKPCYFVRELGSQRVCVGILGVIMAGKVCVRKCVAGTQTENLIFGGCCRDTGLIIGKCSEEPCDRQPWIPVEKGDGCGAGVRGGGKRPRHGLGRDPCCAATGRHRCSAPASLPTRCALLSCPGSGCMGGIRPFLARCRPDVCDAGPAPSQRWVTYSWIYLLSRVCQPPTAAAMWESQVPALMLRG